MKAAKGKGKKPTGSKEQRGFGRAKHDEPRSAAKHGNKPDDKGAFFRKPRPQFAKAAPKPAEEKTATALREIRPYEGARPGERLPVILETEPSNDYALLDSGDGLKLEQYGPYRIVRPEGQAIWLPSLPKSEWDKADAVFTGNTDEEGMGRWAFPHIPLGETWPMQHDGISFHGRFTSFRHVGVFPEQAAHWSYMDSLIREAAKSGRTVKVLNLFGYTVLRHWLQHVRAPK